MLLLGSVPGRATYFLFFVNCWVDNMASAVVATLSGSGLKQSSRPWRSKHQRLGLTVGCREHSSWHTPFYFCSLILYAWLSPASDVIPWCQLAVDYRNWWGSNPGLFWTELNPTLKHCDFSLPVLSHLLQSSNERQLSPAWAVLTFWEHLLSKSSGGVATQ